MTNSCCESKKSLSTGSDKRQRAEQCADELEAAAVIITVRDVDRIVARQPKWKRSVIRANLKLGAAPVNIPQSVLGMKVPDLVREIETRFRSDSRW